MGRLGDEKDFSVVEGWILQLGREQDEDESPFDELIEITSTSKFLST